MARHNEALKITDRAQMAISERANDQALATMAFDDGVN
jgi:hypothetical protein